MKGGPKRTKDINTPRLITLMMLYIGKEKLWWCWFILCTLLKQVDARVFCFRNWEVYCSSNQEPSLQMMLFLSFTFDNIYKTSFSSTFLYFSFLLKKSSRLFSIKWRASLVMLQAVPKNHLESSQPWIQ